ncbi:Hypothetical protein A7982_07461 [Minicystis rosea]|nr:Hypothetical protein A7982_07461 [Minicystis rosea]
MPMRTSMEWARLSPHEMVFATASHAWLEPFEREQSAWGIMVGPGSVETTQKLLDGAIGAAFSAASPAPPLSRTRWAWRLAGMYHLTHRTTPLMHEAARRFTAAGRASLAAWAERKALEERGHDRLALRDLEALGYAADAVVTRVVPPIAARLVRFFEESVRAADPIGCVGYAYALERLATTVREEDIRRVEEMLPPGVRATRCLRMHSAEGGDPDHVDEIVALVAGLSGPERTQVAVACHRAARLCFEAPRDGHPSDEAIEAALRGHKRTAA